jgi:hypothetical protein
MNATRTCPVHFVFHFGGRKLFAGGGSERFLELHDPPKDRFDKPYPRPEVGDYEVLKAQVTGTCRGCFTGWYTIILGLFTFCIVRVPFTAGAVYENLGKDSSLPWGKRRCQRVNIVLEQCTTPYKKVRKTRKT